MGSTREFEEFATASAAMLHRTAWLLTGDAHQAEDLVQEALAKVYVKWRDRKPIDNPFGYTRTTLVRLFISSRRRRSSSEVPTDALPETAVRTADSTSALVLRDALADPAAPDRAVLVLRYYEDRSVAQVGLDLGISEGAVKTRTSRALGRLRVHLGADFLTDAR